MKLPAAGPLPLALALAGVAGCALLLLALLRLLGAPRGLPDGLLETCTAVFELLAVLLLYRAARDSGHRSGHVAADDDASERSRADERLRQSEESLRRLVDCAPDAIVVTDGAGRIERANPQVRGLLGYAPEELVGMALTQLMPPPVAGLHDGYMQAQAGERRGMTAAGREVHALRKDGSQVCVHVRVGEMPYQGGRRFVGFLRDMSEHKRAEQALRLGEERLRKLYDMSPLGIALTDMEGHFLDFNDAFVALTGHAAEALRTMSYWDLTPAEFVADEQRNLQQLLDTGRYGPFEKMYRANSGECRPVRLNGVRIELDGRPCIWSIVEDLTASRHAQQEHDRLLRQLMQSQKMEALGQLTGGIAHDFNNMLTGILGLSSLALERHVDDPAGKLATYLREITRVGERGRDLIERLMRFARPAAGPQPAQPRALRPVAEEVLRMLESALPATLSVRLEAGPALPEARFVELDMHQVLTNLVINARDALAGQGEVVIELAEVNLAGSECASCGQPVCGRHLALRVRDNGNGIAPAHLSRIFDPFFTTKDVGKGTGLGLAMVHSLVHQGGGHLRVRSREGQGTVFEVLLPVADKAKGGGRRICLVDGADAPLAAAAPVLEAAGFDVLHLADPEQALAALRAVPGAFQHLVAVQSLPALPGCALAQAARELQPGLPVVLCLAAGERLEERPTGAGATCLLRLPVQAETLLGALGCATEAPLPN